MRNHRMVQEDEDYASVSSINEQCSVEHDRLVDEVRTILYRNDITLERRPVQKKRNRFRQLRGQLGQGGELDLLEAFYKERPSLPKCPKAEGGVTIRFVHPTCFQERSIENEVTMEELVGQFPSYSAAAKALKAEIELWENWSGVAGCF